MRLSLAVLILALALQPACAQNAASYRIAGTVVSAVDHHPLQRAAIQLLNPEDQKPVQSTVSDEYGHFAFTGVPPGNLELQGTAPNYLATYYDEHEGFNTGIITGAGVDTESLILQLQPEAVIAGVVRDESTEPVQGATVHLFRETHTYGDSRLASAGIGKTDDFGRFEFPRLKPGTYFLAVTATPWYAVHANPDAGAANDATVEQYRLAVTRQNGTSTATFVNSIDPSLNVAYAATYYPGTTDPASAAPITARAGDTRDLNIQLTPRPALTLTLPSDAPKGYTPFAQPQLRISFRGQVLNATPGYTNVPGHTILAGIAPGDYFLSDGRKSSSIIEDSETPIHLSDHSITAELPAAIAQAHIRVSVQSMDGANLPSHTQVVLDRPHVASLASKEIDEKNLATLNVNPGDYAFEVLGDHSSFTVSRVISGEHPLPSNNIRLAPYESAFFTLTVLPRNHTLKGVVRKGNKPCPGAFLLMLPTVEVHDIHTFYRQQSDLDGSFDIRRLAPGDYTLFAIDGGWDLDWSNDAVLSHYLPATTLIHIPNTADNVYTLPRPVAVQPR